MELLQKFTATKIDLKADGDGDAEIGAILSEVDKIDSDGDKILAGAYDDAIRLKQRPDMLYMHRRGDIVGQWKGLRMDGKKLVADGTLYTGEGGFEKAKMGMRLVRTGQMAGVSVGFAATKFSIVRGEDRGRYGYGYDIERLELYEASLVDRPANDSAEVTEIKRRALFGLHSAKHGGGAEIEALHNEIGELRGELATIRKLIEARPAQTPGDRALESIANAMEAL